MLDKLEGKLIAALVTLLVLVLGSVGLFVWGHHVGSVNQSNADNKQVSACTAQNVALAQANKTDAATISGLKKANQDTAAAAEANETQLKASVADLTNKLAQAQTSSAKRQKNLRNVVDHDKTASQWANTPVPPAILDILRQ